MDRTSPIQDDVRRLDIYTESDGQYKDRKTVSCAVTMMGSHCLRVKLQHRPHRHSHREAEFAAQVKGASYGIGMQSMVRAIHGTKAESGAAQFDLWTRRLLWIQHHVSRRNPQIHKVAGSEDKADIGTKHVTAQTLLKLMKAINNEETAWRQPRALKVAHDTGLSLGTENVNMNGDEQNDGNDNDTGINHVGQRRAGRRQVDSFDHSLQLS